MKKARLISVVLALALLCGCAVGICMISAGAEATTTVYTVGDYTEDGAHPFPDANAAFAAAAEKEWGANEQLEIKFKGQISAGGISVGGYVLFNQTTIFREDGSKLPITIEGVDTRSPRDAEIFLDAAQWVACANDYTFKNLLLPIGDQDIEFYAGSGDIKFENVDFRRTSPKIADESVRKAIQKLTHDSSIKVAKDNEVGLLPVGDLWWELSHSEDADLKAIGESLWQKTQTPNPWGDYLHDGDIGGGQYLNACLWFEYLTHRSCVGNTWRPADYTLSEDFVATLQEQAHAFMLKNFDDEWFTESYQPDLNADGTLNVLIIGSSNGAYYPDELCGIANAAGINTRVHHAYSSGISLQTQYNNAENGGEYETHTIWEYNNGSVTNDVRKDDDKDCHIDGVLGTNTWDAIALYQTSNAIFAYGPEITGVDDPAYDGVYTKVLADAAYAKNLYARIRANANADNANLVYYQVAASPIGAPGANAYGTVEGNDFADTCTDAVYAGWSALAEGEKRESSITFGDGTSYYDNKHASVDAIGYRDIKLAAVGYMSDISYNRTEAWTDTEANAVEYIHLDGYTVEQEVRPVDVSATMIFDAPNFSALIASAKFGFAPTDGTVWMKGGNVAALYGDNCATSHTEHYWGDMNIRLSGGTVGNIYLQNQCTVKGDGSIWIEELDATNRPTKVTGDVRGTQGNYAFENGSMTITGGTFAEDVQSFAATGKVTNTIENVTINPAFTAAKGNPAEVENIITNVTFNGIFHGGNDTGNVGSITNTISGSTFKDIFYGASGTVTGDVTNTIKNTTFDKQFYGVYGTVNGTVKNDFTGCTFKALTCAGTKSGAAIQNGVTTKITGCTIEGLYFGAGYNGTVNGGVTNEICGGTTFKSDFFGGFYTGSGTITGGIKNIVKKASDKAPSFEKRFYGGTSGTTTVTGDITNEIDAGTFSGVFYAGNASNQTLTGNITNTIKGGTFNGAIYATNGSMTADNLAGTATVTVAPTVGDITILGTLQSTNAKETVILNGGEFQLLLGKNASIVADTADGTISVKMIGDEWLRNDYVVLPDGSAAKLIVSAVDGVKGFYVLDNGLKGGMYPNSATLILTDRVGVRVLFDKAKVESLETFTYSFVMNGKTLAEGDKDSLVSYVDSNGVEYLSVVLQSVGANDFDSIITCTGSYIPEVTFTVDGLIDAAEDAWKDDPEALSLAVALKEFSVAMNSDEVAAEPTIQPEEVDYEAKKPTRDNEHLINFTGKGLVMANAVGIRLYGEVADAADIENLVVVANGAVTEYAKVKIAENPNGDGKYDVTIDLYVSAAFMDKEMNIVVKDKNGTVCIDFDFRLDAIAQEYFDGTHQGVAEKTQMQAKHLLAYMQAALAYANTQAEE